MGIGEYQDVRDMVRRLRTGDLFAPLALLESPDVEAYKYLDNASVKQSLISAIKAYSYKIGHNGQYLIHFIRDVAKTDRAINIIEKESGSTLQIGQDSSRLLIGLFTSRPVNDRQTANDLKVCLQNLLVNHGVYTTRPIIDPMLDSHNVENSSRQLELFD